MSKFRKAILIIGILIVIIAASLGTALALYATGAIKTDPVELVYEVDPAEKIYDGTPLKADGHTLKSGKLAHGHFARVDYLGSQTDVGSSLSDMSVKIYDTEGYDVTSQYSIKVIGSPISVYQKPIGVNMPDQRVVYNGSKVAFEKYEIIDEGEGGLVSGHRVYGSSEASLINVGDTLSQDLKPLVYDAVGRDVTENYKIDFSVGDIQVVPRQISVRPVSVKKVYDGVELKCSQIEYMEGELVEGQFARWEINNGVNDGLLDAGTLETRVTSFKVYDTVNGEEVDVTENYDVATYERGALEITKRALTVTAKSFEWEYNGEEHSMRGEEQPLKVEGLVEGERVISVSYAGTITDVGSVVNRIREITVINEQTQSGTNDNYEVRFIDGTLTVTPCKVEIVTGSDEKYYDGLPLTAGTTNTALANDGHYMEIAPGSTQPQLINAGSIENKYECAVKDENGIDVTANYKLSYEYGTLTVKKMPVTVTLSDKEEVVYNGEARTPDWSNSEYFKIAAVDDEHDTNLTYADFNVVSFNKSMTDVGEYMYSVQFKQADFSENYSLSVPNYGYLTIKPVALAITTGGVTAPYTGSTYYNTEYQYDTDERPVAGHHLVFPKQGEYPTVTDVGDEPTWNKYDISVADAAGNDVSKNYDLKLTPGALQVNPCKITIALNMLQGNDALTYTGKSVVPDLKKAIAGITSKTVEDKVFNVDFIDYGVFDVVYKQGDKATDAINAGTYQYSLALNGTPAAKNFEIEANASSQLTVNPLPVKVTLKDYSFTYSGSKINIYPAEAVTTDTPLLTGSDFALAFALENGAAVDTLIDGNTYYYTAGIDEENSQQIATNYALTFVSSVMDGTVARPAVTILPKSVSVGLKDLTKTYTAANVSVKIDELISVLDEDGLAKGDFEITFNDGKTEHKDAGQYYLNVALKDETMKKNYKIESQSALLTVKPASATVTLKKVDKTYTADIIKVKPAEAIASVAFVAGAPDTLTGSLATADFEVTFDAAVKNAGTYPIKVAISNDEKVKNYEIKIKETQYLTVAKAEITVSLASFSFTYGAEMDIKLDNAITGISGSLAKDAVENRHLALDLSNVGKRVGTHYFGVTIADAAIAANYKINDAGSRGEIEITKRQIYLAMNDLTVTRKDYNLYNGLFDVTNNVYVTSGSLVYGDTLIITSVTAEDDGEGYLLVNECYYEFGSSEYANCYEIVNADSFTAKLTVID